MKPTPVGAVRIGSGNIDSGNPAPKNAIALATHTGADSWGWQEGKIIANRRLLLGHPSYRDLSAQGMGFQIPDDANDCIMMMRHSVDVVHFSATKACEDLGDSKVGHARTFYMVGYELPDANWKHPFFHINIHPNWVQGIESGPVLDEFVKSMGVLNDMITFVKNLTPYYAVGGDFNITLAEARTRDHATPHNICSRHKMKGRGRRIDHIYWSEALKLVNFDTIPKRLTKSDHPYWLVADLKRK